MQYEILIQVVKRLDTGAILATMDAYESELPVHMETRGPMLLVIWIIEA